MRKTTLVFLCILMVYIFPAASRACRAPYDKTTLETESKQVTEMAAAGDVGGLIQMLETGLFPSKVAAAEFLGEIGDQSALPVLEKLNEVHGAWDNRWSTGQDYDGAFAVAICRILTQDKPPEEQIDALFELLEGKGPAVPESAGSRTMTANDFEQKYRNTLLGRNYDVGRRVAAELDKFDNPDIVKRLRKSENNGAAIPAVWMEVRDMDNEDAIAHCMEIARNEEYAQRYGAIHCLDKFGADAIDALDQLATEGYPDAATALGYQKENPRAFDLLCWHLLNNTNSQVRNASVYQITSVHADAFQLKLLETLIAALYDPNKYIRREASSPLYGRASNPNNAYFDQFRDSLLVAALKHPDEEVRKNVMKAVTQLRYEWSDEQIGEPPAYRTDIDADTPAKELAFQAKIRSLEEKAAKSLKTAPPEDTIKLYEELLEFRPGHEPYEQALKKTKAYIAAAETATEHWYPDAPYIGLKGRYSYYLNSVPENIKELKEKYELAREELETLHYPNWSCIFSKDPKATDQSIKALRLYEHIIEYYPENEYLVLCSKEAVGGLNFNLYRDSKKIISAYVDLFAIDAKEIIDSTNQERNTPLPDAEGMTQAQVDFQKYYKTDELRKRLIEQCTFYARDLKKSGQNHREPFDEIIRRCANTDPNLVEMAKIAKGKFDNTRS